VWKFSSCDRIAVVRIVQEEEVDKSEKGKASNIKPLVLAFSSSTRVISDLR